MKKFKPPVSEYRTDELIFISELSSDDWQKEFVEAARNELTKRGLDKNEIELQSKKINENYQNFQKQEKIRRAEVSYDTFEALNRTIFWYRFILFDWNLKDNGYLTLAKQRIKYLIFGILSYSILFAWAVSGGEKLNHEREIRIAQGVKADSLYRSQVNWTGQYQYNILLPEGQSIWKLNLKKIDDSKHTGKLEVIRDNANSTYHIEAICTDSTVQVFPTKIGLIESFEIKSKYDLLFELLVENGDTLTWWKRLVPFEGDFINGEVNYKKL